MSDFPRWVHTTLYNLREVGPGLFVGNAAAITARDGGGRPLIDFAGWIELGGMDIWVSSPALADRHEMIAEGMGENAMRYGIADLCPVPHEVFDRALALVERVLGRSAGPVLVSCAAGLSRSAVVAYALLQAVPAAISAEEALRRVSKGGFPRCNGDGLASADAWLQRRGIR